MSDSNLLFFEESLDDQLRGRRQLVSRAADGIPKDQFLVSSDTDLIAHIVAKLKVEPLVLRQDAITMSQSETQVDVSGDFRRSFSSGRSGPLYTPGTRIDIEIPFTGDDWIFNYRTNPWSSIFPRADVEGDRLRITISQPHDADPSRFKSTYDDQLQLIEMYVERSRNQVVQFNDSLPTLVQQAVDGRRARLSRHDNIAALLDIPIKAKPGAPSITPVKVEVRRPPPLPAPPKSGLAPEPGITDETYEHILRFIRHQGRTFERTPATYRMHGEEDLRNIVLGQLNGHFEGNAVGEAFRRSGKTDICIEQDNRAAFVGECKLWTGPAAMSSALDQLLGYLTWRDSKAALIIFNTKNKDFSRILSALPTAVRAHRLYLRDLNCSEEGEWRVQMRSVEDEGRRVIIHTFAFNLYDDEFSDQEPLNPDPERTVAVRGPG